MDTKDDGGLEKVSPASKVVIFGSCVNFRGCRFADPLTTIACQQRLESSLFFSRKNGSILPTLREIPCQPTTSELKKNSTPALNWASLMISLDPLCLFYLVWWFLPFYSCKCSISPTRKKREDGNGLERKSGILSPFFPCKIHHFCGFNSLD